MLTDTKLRNLKPSDKIYKITDRDGFYVAVTTSGVISFRYNQDLRKTPLALLLRLAVQVYCLRRRA